MDSKEEEKQQQSEQLEVAYPPLESPNASAASSRPQGINENGNSRNTAATGRLSLDQGADGQRPEPSGLCQCHTQQEVGVETRSSSRTRRATNNHGSGRRVYKWGRRMLTREQLKAAIQAELEEPSDDEVDDADVENEGQDHHRLGTLGNCVSSLITFRKIIETCERGTGRELIMIGGILHRLWEDLSNEEKFYETVRGVYGLELASPAYVSFLVEFYSQSVRFPRMRNLRMGTVERRDIYRLRGIVFELIEELEGEPN